MDAIIRILEVIFLAIVQGVTEFLPISSSAHLIIFREIFQIGSEKNLIFDVALHFGTFLAILVFFFKEFLTLGKGAIKKEGVKERRLLLMVLIGIIPAAIAGILFEDIIDGIIRDNLLIIALGLVFMGIVMYQVDIRTPQEKGIEDISISDACLIGFMQVFALIPGLSRSGTTITAGRIAKLKRADAAKFSFYMSLPLVLGAFIFTMARRESIELVRNNIPTFAIGILVSFLVGIFVIGFLLRYIRKNDFKAFMYYRFFVAFVILIYLIATNVTP